MRRAVLPLGVDVGIIALASGLDDARGITFDDSELDQCR